MQNSQEIQGKQIEEILEVIKSDFNVDNDILKKTNRVKEVSKTLFKVTDKESIESLNMLIDKIYEDIRTPLENKFYKMQTLDFAQLTPDDIAKQIQEFVLIGSNTIKELKGKKNFEVVHMYKEGLEKLSKDALVQLSSDYRANKANAIVKGKLADVNEFLNVSNKLGFLDGERNDRDLEESEIEIYNALLEQQDEAIGKVCENSIVDLRRGAFLGDDIGKATINVSTVLKDRCQEKIKRDQKEIETVKNDKGNTYE